MIKRNIPNAITCGNLLCGCFAIASIFKGDLMWGAYLVGIAAVLDFFDGFVARLLRVTSPIGKELDSLADVITFGVVPGMMMLKMIQNSITLDNSLSLVDSFMNSQEAHIKLPPSISYIAFLIPIFSAIRLAKFNIDTHQSDSFTGLPTPACAILICSLPLVINQLMPLSLSTLLSSSDLSVLTTFWPVVILRSPYFYIGLTILMSYLLVSKLSLFALKFKNFRWANNKVRYIFLIISLILLILFQFIAIPFIIFLYVLLSMINNIGSKRKQSNP